MGNGFELGFIGAGNMAEGIAAGALDAGLYVPQRLIASDPSPQRREVFARRGVATTDDNAKVVAQSDALILSIKPQSFEQVAQALRGSVRNDQPVFSIMAGVSTRRIAEGLGGKVRVVRVMPNLPIHVGAGITGICRGEHATDDDVARARRIFDAGGDTVVLEHESLLDAVTAVSGSGPAYFYYFVEAITAGGVAAGLSECDALKLAENTCLGAARMMLETGEPPAELRRKVTSPGGTTQAAIESMNASNVPEAIRKAVVAAADRSRALGKETASADAGMQG